MHCTRWSSALALLALAGCGKEQVSGTMQFVNGATSAPATPALAAAQQQLTAPADGQWKLTPKKMTVTVTGISFAEPGAGSSALSNNQVSVSGCTASYDQTQASLLPLSNCSFKVAAGTYGSVTIAYSTTYQALIEDPSGIYSDPASPSGLSTARPAGGPSFISVKDTNGGSDTNYMTTFFTPIAVDNTHPPQLYVVFNPIHWMVTNISGGVPGAPQMSGNPPITPALSGFGKAAFYSNLSSIQAFNNGSCAAASNSCSSFLVLYSDASTAQSVSQVDGNLQLCNGTNNSANVAFNQNGLSWGMFGMLGRDSGGVLSWAIAGPSTSDRTAITGYRGVLELSEVASLGGSTTLIYHCTTSPPAPAGGAVNYASGHPTIPADGTISLTLLAH